MDRRQAFRYCERLAKDHYENFTVGSWMLPADVRPHVWAIYAYCRRTDDLGDLAAGDRLAQLDAWEKELLETFEGGQEPEHPVLAALQETVERFAIPPQPFLKLIEANRIDQRVKRHETFEDVLRYCEHSANPVGHLVLYLFGYRDPEREKLADSTCTALQLTNFLQDIALDSMRDRVYLPQEDLRRFSYTEAELLRGTVNERFRDLMQFEIERTRRLFEEGMPLIDLVDRRLRADVKLFNRGGLKVLEAIERVGYDVFRHRPTLSGREKARLLLGVLWERWGVSRSERRKGNVPTSSGPVG